MSTIILETFAVYKCAKEKPKSTSQVKPISGISDVRITDNGMLELVLASVPMRTRKMQARMPTGGLLMLYGMRDTAMELQRMRLEARRLGAEFAFAKFEIDVGKIPVDFVNYEMLKNEPKMKFLAVRRMTKELQTGVLETFERHTTDKSVLDQKLKREIQIGSRPDLWDRLYEDAEFANEKNNLFKNIGVISIPINDDPEKAVSKGGGLRHVAYVRPGAKVVSEIQGSRFVKLVLPDWMK